VGTSTKLLHKKSPFISEDTPIVPAKKKYAIGKDGTKVSHRVFQVFISDFFFKKKGIFPYTKTL
jgi:hypothetical protein